ncbi:hypothetical protein J1N35_007848 [Gossypium stocksii]|uniref:Zinc knuckle CX2CX4HX4C domain-containing protein n=1 Tax=Gossypium stocksii TaxID=47602 RepID=A0A9D3W982_9ROSI|nr:hypothetical protein J1N35_007848 [Gossypium stocksii]
MHAMGSTFGGVIRSGIKGEFCRIRVNLDVQKPLRRGIFVSPNRQGKTWLSFKYESLPTFCFGCDRLGHGVKDCTKIPLGDQVKTEDELPYSITLKAESSIIEKKSLWFGYLKKKTMKQCYYTGVEETGCEENCSTDFTKQKHRTVTESYSERNSIF